MLRINRILEQNFVNFKNDVSVEINNVLEQKDMTISQLRLDNERLRALNRRLNSENIRLSLKCNESRNIDFVNGDRGDSQDAQPSSTSSYDHSMPTGPSAKRTKPNIEYTVVNSDYRSSNGHPQSSVDIVDPRWDHPAAPLAVTAGDDSVHEVEEEAVEEAGDPCSSCQQDSAVYRGLCLICRSWGHQCGVLAALGDEEACAYCHLLETRRHPEDIAMDCIPRGAEKLSKKWEFFWNFTLRDGHNLKVGDCVYLVNKNGADKTLKKNWDIFRIQHLYTDKSNQFYIYGFLYFRAVRTMYKPTKRFYKNEVFEVTDYASATLGEVRGLCSVLRLSDFVKGAPHPFDDEDVFVCEQSYHYKLKADASGQLTSEHISTRYDKLKHPKDFPICYDNLGFQKRRSPLQITRDHYADGDQLLKDKRKNTSTPATKGRK